MYARPPTLIAADIGNSRIKLGRFERIDQCPGASLDGSLPIAGPPLPEPSDALDLPIRIETGEFDTERFAVWCGTLPPDAAWLVASVHRGATEMLAAAVAEIAARTNGAWPLRQVTYRDIPIAIEVDEPERVGIDRLLAAFAADRLRARGRPAIVVDLGTCIKVDLVTAEGAFAGGAILPGIAMAARALNEQTDALPRVALQTLDQPFAPLGKSTVPAIEAGLYWGAVGAIREIAHRLSANLAAPPSLVLTGGASPAVTELLAQNETWELRHVPHLTLAGIALVDESLANAANTNAD